MRTPEIKAKYIAYRKALRRAEALMTDLRSLEMRAICDREENRRKLAITRNQIKGIEKTLRETREAALAPPNPTPPKPKPVQLTLKLS